VVRLTKWAFYAAQPGLGKYFLCTFYIDYASKVEHRNNNASEIWNVWGVWRGQEKRLALSLMITQLCRLPNATSDGRIASTIIKTQSERLLAPTDGKSLSHQRKILRALALLLNRLLSWLLDTPVTLAMPEFDAAADSSHEIPRAAVGRLSLYLRELRRLSANGFECVSSKRLGELLGVSDAVVRRDLGYLKPQGRRGVGYLIPPLIERIRQTLGSNHVWNVVLIGVGSLGNALLRYQGFQEQGFRWVAAFDVDPQRIGKSVGGVPVFGCEDLERQVSDLEANLAIIAVPAPATNDIARRLSTAGVTGILNFAPVVLQVGGETCVANVDLASELQQLAFSVLSFRDSAEEVGPDKPKKNR